MQAQKGRGRGFASMSPEKKREIASKGGKAAHSLGTAHKWKAKRLRQPDAKVVLSAAVARRVLFRRKFNYKKGWRPGASLFCS